ncbi:unnamed protein product [Rhodiola kirilowii]
MQAGLRKKEPKEKIKNITFTLIHPPVVCKLDPSGEDSFL